jgi:hypothetical protein
LPFLPKEYLLGRFYRSFLSQFHATKITFHLLSFFKASFIVERKKSYLRVAKKTVICPLYDLLYFVLFFITFQALMIREGEVRVTNLREQYSSAWLLPECVLIPRAKTI